MIAELSIKLNGFNSQDVVVEIRLMKLNEGMHKDEEVRFYSSTERRNRRAKMNSWRKEVSRLKDSYLYYFLITVKD